VILAARMCDLDITSNPTISDSGAELARPRKRYGFKTPLEILSQSDSRVALVG
jgi:hypothetical protein